MPWHTAQATIQNREHKWFKKDFKTFVLLYYLLCFPFVFQSQSNIQVRGFIQFKGELVLRCWCGLRYKLGIDGLLAISLLIRHRDKTMC